MCGSGLRILSKVEIAIMGVAIGKMRKRRRDLGLMVMMILALILIIFWIISCDEMFHGKFYDKMR